MMLANIIYAATAVILLGSLGLFIWDWRMLASMPKGPTPTEIREGTPRTPKREETIRRAEETFAKTKVTWTKL